MQVEVSADDLLIRPMIGPGGLTRDEAHAEIQSLLDRSVAAGLPGEVARTWRRGAKDDTVYAGLLTWTIYEHPDGEDPRRAALAWLEGYAEAMRGMGLDVQVARLP
ncbi:hypothetical protein, partial [Rhizomonospora bruguierae]|uniref:hypothetical protein n=1 Tax=Rhizomonospora bruguierae TaxID=1581705 RepID=UPI001BCFF6DA